MFVLLAAATAGWPAPDGDTLRFSNSDRLQGTLLQIHPAEGLRWQTSLAAEPIRFGLPGLVEVQLAPRPPRTSRALHAATVELTNDDQLAGDVVSLDPTTLLLDTWYAGRLRIPRAFLRRLETRAARGLVYAGPSGQGEWKMIQPGWVYQRGALYSSRHQYAVATREVGLPDLANVEFEVTWQGQPQWGVGVYFREAGLATGGYLLQFSGSNFTLQRYSGGSSRAMENSQQLDPRNPRTRSPRTSARVSLRVNKAKSAIALLCDGQLLKQWTDPKEFAGSGTSLLFMSQGQGQARIRNIQISEWDGQVDVEGTRLPTGPAADVVVLRNRDKVSGAIHSIRANEVGLSNSFAAVQIPLDKVASLEFAAKPAAPERPPTGDVRAFLPDGTRLTMALGGLDAAGLAGTSESCGAVLLPIDTFLRLQFRPFTRSVAADPEEEWPNEEPVGPGRRGGGRMLR